MSTHNRLPMTKSHSIPLDSDLPGADEKPEGTRQQHLENWLAAHQGSYISHAIWEDNVEPLLTSGFAHPAEYVLRHNLTVSYEAGSGEGIRGKLDLGPSLDRIRKRTTPLPPIIECDDKIKASMALKLNLITEDQSDEIDREYNRWRRAKKKGENITEVFKHNIQLNDGRTYAVSLNQNDDLIIEGIPYLKFNKSAVTEEEKAADRIAEDHLSSDPLDKTLAKVWERYLALLGNNDPREIANTLLDYRRLGISVPKLSRNVRTCYNGIMWQYGEVAVLRGNPEKLLSIINKSNDDSDMQKSLSEVQLAAGYEAFLLQPFENGGKFLSLDLSDKDTIVIGPQAILSAYLEKMPSVRTVFFEDMNEKQLEFFKVKPLKQQIVESAATPSQAQNKSSLFSHPSRDADKDASADKTASPLPPPRRGSSM